MWLIPLESLNGAIRALDFKPSEAVHCLLLFFPIPSSKLGSLLIGLKARSRFTHIPHSTRDFLDLLAHASFSASGIVFCVMVTSYSAFSPFSL